MLNEVDMAYWSIITGEIVVIHCLLCPLLLWESKFASKKIHWISSVEQLTSGITGIALCNIGTQGVLYGKTTHEDDFWQYVFLFN